MTEFCFLYVTCSSHDEAEKICSALLREHLVACGNIIPEMKSLYWWEGKITAANEVVLILKTRREHFQICSNKIKSIHSYTTPCILELPITEGHPDYLRWLSAETTTPH